MLSNELPGASGEPGLLTLTIGDGCPLLAFSAMILILAGMFALFLSIRKEFLPHDVSYLGMTPEALCAVNECRIVHFMIHDRVSFGGSLIALGIVYLWLVVEPLAAGAKWAWDLLVVSAIEGFLSFLAYLGYGYLDTWHGTGTLLLAPFFIVGLATVARKGWCQSPGSWWAAPIWMTTWRDRHCLGRILLCATAIGMIGGGLTICAVGMSTVFVPQDVVFLGMGRKEMDAINPRLVSLIAHDRAGFGGAVCCCGITLGGIAWRGILSRACRQALAMAGVFGFATAVLVHPAIGYIDILHLLPAIAGAILFVAGLVLLGSERQSAEFTSSSK